MRGKKKNPAGKQGLLPGFETVSDSVRLLFGGIFFQLVEFLRIHQFVECVCCDFVLFIRVDIVEVWLAVLFIIAVQINFAVPVLAVFIERQKSDVLFLVRGRENGQYGTFYFGIISETST